MTEFSAYFNGTTVYINGAKKYVLGEILERILGKRYRELDRLYSECKRYETILHYPEDMREADESERLFQGAIALYAKIEQMIANTPPYSAMDIQRDTLRTILNLHSWAFEEDELIDADTEKHYHFYVRIGSNDMEDAELLRDIYKLNDRLKAFATEMRVFIEDILRVKRTFEPFLEKIHSQSRYLDNNETAQVVYDRRDKPYFSAQHYERLEPSGVMRLSYEVLWKKKSPELCQHYTFTTLGGYLYIELFKGLEMHYLPKKCGYCGKYFLLTAGLFSDYCTREIEGMDGRVCRDMGHRKKYADKIKTNPYWNVYNKAYKQHYARYLKKKMTQAEFAEWADYALELRSKAENGEIEFEEYRVRIRK